MSRSKRLKEESKTEACVKGLSTNYICSGVSGAKNKRGVGVVRNDEQKDTEVKPNVAGTMA